MASDVEKALKLERDRYMELIETQNRDERQSIERLKFDERRRGTFQSGGTLISLTQIRTAKFERLIDGAIAIRKEIALEVPELGTETALDARLDELTRSLHLAFEGLYRELPWITEHPAAEKEIWHRANGTIEQLKSRAKRGIDILKGEFALNFHKTSRIQTVAVNTAGGPAVVNVGEIRGNVQQVVGTLNEVGNRDLAQHLDRLAAAIEAATDLGGERQAYLEQVQFIAREALEPAATRQSSIVQGVFEGMRARLQDVANIAQILAVAAPTVAHHFGIKLLG